MQHPSLVWVQEDPAGTPLTLTCAQKQTGAGRRDTLAREAETGEEPDYRFSMANERTFLAYIRTSLALLAGGIAVEQLLPPFSVPGGRLVLSVLLLALSSLVAAASYRRWRATERAMRLQVPLPATRLPLVLGTSLIVTACGVLLLALIKAFQ